ncbi:MAG: hypothetical protein EHM35_13120 [Planctomycetaceae bacterium]|nr:MAG: hypothetical protein EHM35_13120 [Planctomycetaceae bacterium]
MSTVLAVCLVCQSPSLSRDALLRRTWEAVCLKESGGNPRAYRKSEDAAGIGQIRPVMVAEVNRIQKARVFTLAQRFDPLLSFEMFRIHSLAYAPNGTPEQWARLWNGGGSGLKKRSTIQYGRAIARLMKETR